MLIPRAVRGKAEGFNADTWKLSWFLNTNEDDQLSLASSRKLEARGTLQDAVSDGKAVEPPVDHDTDSQLRRR